MDTIKITPKTTEAQFQRMLIKCLEAHDNIFVLVNDPHRIQGIPDLLVLVGKYWVALELKKHANSPRQINQEWYIDRFSEQGSAFFVHFDNYEEIVYEILSAASAGRCPFSHEPQ